MLETDHQNKIEEVLRGLADLYAQAALYVDELRALMAAAPTQSNGCVCCGQDRCGNQRVRRRPRPHRRPIFTLGGLGGAALLPGTDAAFSVIRTTGPSPQSVRHL